MARSFSFDHYREPKRDVRPVRRAEDRSALAESRRRLPLPGEPLVMHGEAQSRTRELWRQKHDAAPAEERRATKRVASREREFPIGAVPPPGRAEEPPGEILEEFERVRAPGGRVGEGLAEARISLEELQRSLGSAAGALTRLLRIPVDLLRGRHPQPH